jgi:hypothetical protein
LPKHGGVCRRLDHIADVVIRGRQRRIGKDQRYGPGHQRSGRDKRGTHKLAPIPAREEKRFQMTSAFLARDG